MQTRIAVPTVRRSPRLWLGLLFALLLLIQPALTTGVMGQTGEEPAEVGFILPGELFSANLAADEPLLLTLSLPVEGTYSFFNQNPGVPLALTIQDEADEILFDDVWESASADDVLELDLDAGSYLLSVTAAEETILDIVITGAVGEMSADYDAPGQLYLGSVYTAQPGQTYHYATLDAPVLGYPYLLMIFAEPDDEEGSLYISVESQEFGFQGIGTDESNMLGLWTEGGRYLVGVDTFPLDSGFTVTVMASGAPPILGVGDSLEAAFSPGLDSIVYRLQLDTIYNSLQLEMLGPVDDPDVDLDLIMVDFLFGGDFYQASSQWGSEEFLDLTDIFPGIYHVIVRNYSGGSPAFSLTIDGEPGDPLLDLVEGEVIRDEIAAEEVKFYRLVLPAPGVFVTVDLRADDPDQDLDLAIGSSQFDTPWRSMSVSGNETISLVAPAAAEYIVQVISYGGAESGYELEVIFNDDAPFLTSGTVIADQVSDGEDTVYAYLVEEGNQLVSLLLLTEPDALIDVTANIFDGSGRIVNTLYGDVVNGVGAITTFIREPGLMEITVRTYFESADYQILLRGENVEALFLSAMDDADLSADEVEDAMDEEEMDEDEMAEDEMDEADAEDDDTDE